MNCTNCKKEDQWLEVIGSDFICKKCINKHKIMSLVFRTHTDTFHFLIRKIKPQNYQEFMAVTRKQIENLVNLKKYGIFLKTTNVVEIE
jgi:hypothetical protein